jgi:hypothetical protein
MNEKKEEQTAGAKLREIFFAKKRSLKPSQKLIETFQKKNKSEDLEKKESDKKVARPLTPEAGA